MRHTLRFFVPPDRWFAMLDEITDEHDAEIVFQRGKTPQHEPGLHLATAENLMEEFHSGGYGIIWISASLVPAHEKDWDFVERSQQDLLESRGGLWDDKRLGVRTIRILAKETRVRGLFDAFATAIKDICERGMETEGHAQRDVLYVPDSGWKYVSDLEYGEEYTPL